MVDLSLASQTMFAELLQRCLDAEFDELYNERGRFVRVRSRGCFTGISAQRSMARVARFMSAP